VAKVLPRSLPVPARLSSRRTDRAERPVPLARRLLLAHPGRLARSISGIAFAILLMMVELGFRDGFIDSMLLPIRALDADVVLLSDGKYQFDRPAPLSRRFLYEAEAVSGVASVRPLYAARTGALWKNPQDRRRFIVQVFAFDPDAPVFALPAVTANLAALRLPDTVLVDRRARDFLGTAENGTRTELAGRRVRVASTFSLGPDFFTDGTVLMGDRTFLTFFAATAAGEAAPPGPAAPVPELADVEAGIVKAAPGRSPEALRRALRAALPKGVDVLTKPQLLAREAAFHASVSPVGPVFGAGTLVGFVVGMLIAYQTLFSDVSDQLPQYATMKAMGYASPRLAAVVLRQAALYAAVAYGPAWILCALLFRLVSDVALMPVQMSLSLTLITAALTLAMCLSAALVALRRLFSADPAELFR